MPAPYRPRLVDPVIDELLASLPAVLLVGPRATGKTTTALRRARTTLRLDRPAIAAAVENDPDAALADCEPPVLIDEWQLVPSVLGAVKRSIDTDAGSGHYLLTGSSRADLQAEGWPATGRVVRVPVWPMTVRERLGYLDRPSIVDRLFDRELDDLALPDEQLDVRGYVNLALQSGFPELIGQTSARVRRAWLGTYVDQTVLRDAPFSSHGRDPQRLRAYLAAIAANSAEVVTDKTLHDAAGITRVTATAYDSLLEMLSITERVPAYSTNRLRRLIRAPKRYLIDPALLVPLLRVDARAIVRDARLVGAVIDTFVVAQLRTELTAADTSAAMFHLRDAGGRHEADLVLEGPLGQIVAIEIKANAAPTRDMARHLTWYQEQLGDQFVAGVLFHTGPRPFQMAERIWALPIAALWS